VSDFRPDIWRLQAQLNTQGLVDALANEDAGIRKRAAAALRALGATNTIPDLKAVLDQEGDPETRAHIVAALEALQQELERQQNKTGDTSEEPVVASEVERWIAQLNSDKSEQVIEAAKALGELNDKLAVAPMIVLFNNPNLPIKVRLAVAEALINLESAPVEVALLGALRSRDWRVRRNGAAILGQLRADWAIEPLSNALRDENETVRKTAFAALKHIGSPEALKALQAAPKSLPPKPAPSPSAPQSGLRARVQTDVPPNAASPDEEGGEGLSNEDTQKISWPRRGNDTNNPMLAPTRPLNPNVLDEARARFEKLKKDKKNDDSK